MLWQTKRRIELAYQKSLMQIIYFCVGSYHKYKTPLEFEMAMRTYVESDAFIKYSLNVASKCITHLFEDVGKSWRQAAQGNSQGATIYELLTNTLSGERGERVKRMIEDNAKIIRTLPISTAESVTRYINREALKGRRASDIEKDLDKLFIKKGRAKAKLIARTEVAKTQTALVKSDCDIVGVKWYFWKSTKDQRTRDAHSRMNDVICSWDAPPNPEKLFPQKGVRPYGSYPPGGTFNCRCYPVPIVTKSQLTKNTYRVHLNGRIVKLKRADVIKMI